MHTAETQWRWVTELSALDTLVKTWLEFTTECWKKPASIRIVGPHVSQRAISKSSGMNGPLFLLMAHALGCLLKIMVGNSVRVATVLRIVLLVRRQRGRLCEPVGCYLVVYFSQFGGSWKRWVELK